MRRYYFPIAAGKRISYSRIWAAWERRLSALSGKGRIRGSGDLPHCAPLDPNGPRKDRATVLALGGWIKPVIRLDDPDRVPAILRERVPPAGRTPAPACAVQRAQVAGAGHGARAVRRRQQAHRVIARNPT